MYRKQRCLIYQTTWSLDDGLFISVCASTLIPTGTTTTMVELQQQYSVLSKI